MNNKGQHYGVTYIANFPLGIFIFILSVSLMAIGYFIPFFYMFLVIGFLLFILWICHTILVFYAERMG